ncbi:hypothetical protein [Staphylococcus chromogenes]|uniref:hypothetical protein n=1 Tax=Staphylococcus chromogenes TaxID=46126 RepID=UPI0010AD9946|nr:hypothetical protein [Staphylococcus chromogenes]TJY17607.1 hypothetical protein FCF12_02545 [Staphylococcus chromogenes]
MEKYNRDLHSKGLESYEVSQYDREAPQRLDLVFGFVAGAVLGSSLGLLLKPTLEAKSKKKEQVKTKKVNDQNSTLRDEAKRKAEALKAQAQRVRKDSQRERSVLTDSEDPSSKELAAQRRAIQSEVDSDRLEGQTSKSAREENNGQNTAGVATAGVTASGLAQAAKNSDQQKENETSISSDSKDDAMAAQQRAIRAEVDSDRLEGQTGPTATAQAEGKDEKLSQEKSNQQKTSENTASLGAQRRLLNGNKKESTTTSANKENDFSKKDAKFDNGVVTHDSDKDFTLSDHNEKVKEEAKKTNSKVDKHTFNK